MHLRVALAGLDLGQDVGGSAGHDHHFDVVGLLERRQHLVGVEPLHGPAVHAQVKRRFGVGLGDGEQGAHAGQTEQSSAFEVFHWRDLPLSSYGNGVKPGDGKRIQRRL
ncbi:hypothetical protein D3C87_1883110 [compost metagenome]